MITRMYSWKNMKKLSTVQKIRLALRALGVIYLVIPTAFYASSHFRRFLIFGAYITWPFHDYSKPDTYGFPHAKNFYVNSVGDIRLGAWYMPPKSNWDKFSSNPQTKELQKWMFEDEKPIIIYYHGHANCRACDYRIGLYKVLTQGVDAHVFTFDYRGFADSTSVLPEREGILHDSTVIFDYVRKLVKNDDSRILIWGHSLGTGVALQLAEALTELERKPMGIVLEAPFNSLVKAAMAWPISLPYRYFPWMSHIIGKLRDNDETFYESEQLAAEIQFPVLVLHSQDDCLVPYVLGRKLFEKLKALSKGPVEFYEVNAKYSTGHRYIFTDPGVQERVSNFIKVCSGLITTSQPTESVGENDATVKEEL